MPKNENAEKNNPCLKEQELSFQCLNKNNFDREKCEAYFVNYNSCKKFWNDIRIDRRNKGIIPNLPEVKDREEVKKEYMSKMK